MLSRLTILIFAAFGATIAVAEDYAFFESKIRPVLAENCYECHSASAAAEGKLKAGLQLDTRAGIQVGGDSGPALPLLLSALRHEGDLKMPPKNKLSDSIVADFAKWIEMGAPDPRDGEAVIAKKGDVDIEAGKQHWSFGPLTNPTPPTPKDAKWIRTDVDRFIRAEQEAKGVDPNPIADRLTLIRRTYFDLIGLPPTPEQVEAALKISHAELVRQLLNSEHYGERWGRHWLDLVRFAESNGYAFDRDRPNAWRYRDWVINVLNAGMPYDEFVKLQLTGDIAAGADWDTSDKAARALDLTTATGFIVAGPFTTQQTQKERERSRYEQLDDMIHTLGTSMLGLTVGCARCHDHKYDPIGEHDYYELAAMFGDVGFADVGVDLQPHIYRDAKAAWDKVHNPLVEARTARENELVSMLDAFVDEHAKSAAAVEFGEWSSIGPFKAKDFNVAFADKFGPETDFNLDFEDDEHKWIAQPDWTDGEARNDILKGANSVFYLKREIVSPKPQSIGLSISANDGLKLWINGFKAGEEKRGGDARADELKVHLPLVEGRNVLLMKIANGGGEAGFYFQTSLEAGREPKNVGPILKIDREKWNGGQRNAVSAWHRQHDPRWLELNAPVVASLEKQPKPDLTLTYAAKTRGTSYQFGANTYNVFHLHRGNSDNKKDLARAGFLRVLSRESEGHWLGVEDPKPDERWTVLKPTSAKAETTKLNIAPDGQISASGDLAGVDSYTIEIPVPQKLSALGIRVSPSQTANFVLSQVAARWIPENGEPQRIEFDSTAASFVQGGFDSNHILAPEINAGRGWALAGGLGKEQELALFLKDPKELSGGKIEITLVQKSQWPQHLLSNFALTATGAADARDWAAKPSAPPTRDENLPHPREALAQWITDTENGAGPLLARVIVNRLWQHHMGRGIVATPSDFGTRGERPTHPELLDYLAQQLLENGWRLKPIHELIMTSAVYMQGGGDALGGLSHDPENLLYWRQPSRRMEAEIIRDNLLAVSGKIDPATGGKGTLDANSTRRSVYLTVKRGRLIEMLQLFDAPDAMQSIGAREVSTVAPQALAMLNSTAVRNWAVDLARRAKPSPETTIEQAVDAAYQIAYSRPPAADERAEMLDFIGRQAAAREGKVDDAFQDFCHLLLCANEFIYVD
ncbi:MAG: PSD1 and planctomycete cytochrome C domain-containing protein, partial [Verrucomicrobiota bacterium]